MTEYYNEKIECMTQEELKSLQLKLFNRQLKRAGLTKAYKGKLPDKITDLSEIKKLPFTTKDDLRQNFPYGFLAVPKEKIARFNASSGTSGAMTLIALSVKDTDLAVEVVKKSFIAIGIKRKDVVQNMLSLGLAVGGWSDYHAAKDFQITVIPTGAGNTQRQIFFLKTLNPTVSISTSGYLQYLFSCLSPNEILNLKLKKCICLGEPCSAEFKELLRNKYKIEIFEFYGLSECMGDIASECLAHTGLHVQEDVFYIEIINPETGEVLPDGEYGELVVTPLQQEAMPLIRYRTRDITRIIPGECPCGRTHHRIEPITHRIDDMMIINGVNVFPSQIEECIYKNLATATNYLIHITEKEGLKKLLIDIELPNDLLNNIERLKKFEKELITTLKAHITVTPKLNFIPLGTLPEIQGKAKRVVKD